MQVNFQAKTGLITMVDCLHVAIAKTNNLLFVTHEGKIGVLKEFYENITTFNHLSKMFS